MSDVDLSKIGAPATRALASIGITRLEKVADRSEAELLAPSTGSVLAPSTSLTNHLQLAVSRYVPERRLGVPSDLDPGIPSPVDLRALFQTPQ